MKNIMCNNTKILIIINTLRLDYVKVAIKFIQIKNDIMGTLTRLNMAIISSPQV